MNQLYSPNTPNYVREQMFAQLRTGLRLRVSEAVRRVREGVQKLKAVIEIRRASARGGFIAESVYVWVTEVFAVLGASGEVQTEE